MKQRRIASVDVVVDDLGTPSMTAALAGGRLAFEGLLPNVLALGLGHAGRELELGGAVPGRVVHALEGAGEFELGVVVAQVLGDGQQLGGAAALLLRPSPGRSRPWRPRSPRTTGPPRR